MKVVKVKELPECDFCKLGECVSDFEVRMAQYDGMTKFGPHAYMCGEALTRYGYPESSITVKLEVEQ